MPIVQMPDGARVSFPDDMPREQIRDMIAKKFPSAPAQPEERGIFRRVDDTVRGVADTATFGFADEIAAKLGEITGVGSAGSDYDANVAAERQRDREGGWERFGGQIAGALTNPAAIARSVPQAVKQGMAAGAAYGFGSGEGGFQDRAVNAGIGSVVGGVAGGALKGITNAFGNRVAAKAIPSIEDLRNASQAGYRAAEAAGVIVRPEGMRRVATETVGDLAEFGYHPALQPKIGTILKEMERLGNTNATYKGLDQLRKIAGQVAGSTEPAERAMATRIVQRLDDYMANLSPEDLIMGNAAQASAGIRQGRDNWARMRRAEMVDTAAIKAKRRADTTGTGGNLENTLRQNVRAILDNPKRSRGMTPAETAMAEKVVSGTPAQDALRLVGRLSPTTGGLSAALNVGATAVNPMMAIPGGIGMASKAAAERLTKRNVEQLSQIIRSGGNTAKDLANLARGGQLDIAGVQRVENVAKALGVSVPEIAVMLKERAIAE